MDSASHSIGKQTDNVVPYRHLLTFESSFDVPLIHQVNLTMLL